MARIRTVKPEIWTDPEFTEMCVSARLLLIALLNFATDHGVLPDKPRQLKMQCMPADDIAIEPLIEELIAGRFLIRTTAPNGDAVLLIRTFAKNQKINRPSEGRWGDPAKWSQAPEIHARLSEDAEHLSEAHPPEGKGRDNSEGDDLEGETSRRHSTGSTASTARRDDDDRMPEVIKLITDELVTKFPPKASPKNHRNTIAIDVRAKHTEAIREFLDANPDHPAELVARRFLLEIA